ncbi:MAG: methylenetetrahydrofolate reductase [Gammaproteobacteria bacterium]|jgi:methylenetetrahydrofolate reductase (NADPH)|nr:methylenetetrahydrofolate reductase [Gammaproteobacteria bacterium]
MTLPVPQEKEVLAYTVREAYMEVFPTDTIEAKLDVLEPGSYVAVTCSPTKGVDVTLDMCERLALRGFKVVPHIAAKMVRDKAHLREIIAHLNDLPIISIFVPGGDADQPIGDYDTALSLLRDIAELDHKFTEIGVAAHPEGHPVASDEELLKSLLQKQELANYLVTQMCFDADVLGAWLHSIRQAGVHLPAWIGLPGVADRGALFKTSLRIGVGDSLRYLKRNPRVAARLMLSNEYRPDELLLDLAPYLADRDCNIKGHHIYCFNQVEKTEHWRHAFLEGMN